MCSYCIGQLHGYDLEEEAMVRALLGGAVRAALHSSVGAALVRRVVDEAIGDGAGTVTALDDDGLTPVGASWSHIVDGYLRALTVQGLSTLERTEIERCAASAQAAADRWSRRRG